jgi:hypothetical protein
MQVGPNRLAWHAWQRLQGATLFGMLAAVEVLAIA